MCLPGLRPLTPLRLRCDRVLDTACRSARTAGPASRPFPFSLAPFPAHPASWSPRIGQERPLFEDDDAKAFYQSLPDLRALLPVKPETAAAGKGAEDADEDRKDEDETPAAEATKAPSDDTAAAKPEARKGPWRSPEKNLAALDDLLPAIARCANRDLVDQLASKVVPIASFAVRKRLVQVSGPSFL